ncbi:MAG: helix-turn-helix transcriptional regulator [Verrucomicrobiae bacterium]
MPKKKKVESWPVVLKDWRARRGITQKEAAERLGVAMRTYQGWEGGEKKPIFPSPGAAEEIFKP